MIQAVIFDCFGVLLIDAQQSFLERYAEHRKQLLELRAQADAGLLGRKDLLDGFMAITGASAEELEQLLRTEHQINEPLMAYIRELKNTGLKIGMLSNLGRGWFDELFPKGPLRDLFDDIIISGEVKMVKPQPEIYHLACDQLGVEPAQIVFVDDIEWNCEGARAIGMHAVRYHDVDRLKLKLEALGIQV